MERITRKHLYALADRINTLMGTPRKYMNEGGRIQIGHYTISGAYGGFMLVQITTEGGGERTVFGYGHMPARACYQMMIAYITGLEEGRQNARDESIARLAA